MSTSTQLYCRHWTKSAEMQRSELLFLLSSFFIYYHSNIPITDINAWKSRTCKIMWDQGTCYHRICRDPTWDHIGIKRDPMLDQTWSHMGSQWIIMICCDPRWDHVWSDMGSCMIRQGITLDHTWSLFQIHVRSHNILMGIMLRSCMIPIKILPYPLQDLTRYFY